MKHSLRLILVFLFFQTTVKAQLPAWGWSTANGGSLYDYGSAVTIDPSGYIVATGHYYGDTIIFAGDTLRNAGMNDIYLVKYDSGGNLLWSYRAGNDGDDQSFAVTTDIMANIYIAGHFTSDTLIIGNDTLVNAGPGNPDIFLARFDPNGNPQWARREGTPNWDIALSVSADTASGNIYLGGSFYNDNIRVGNDSFVNNGLYDLLLVKYDPAGNPLWARAAGGALNDMNNAVAAGVDGMVYISGGFASDTVRLDTAVLINAGAGLPDIFAAKFDADGNLRWAHREGDTDNDHSVTIATDIFGNCFVAGHYHSISFPFGNDTIVNNGMGDLYILKYDSLGNALWGRGEGDMMHDFGYALAVDAFGNAYFAGMYSSAMMTVGSFMLVNTSSNEDMVLIKYDPAGNVLWAISEGGTGNDYINSVALDRWGTIFVTGSWQSPELGLGNYYFFNADSVAGFADIFISRLDIPLGIQSSVQKNSAQVYPNPTNGKFRIASEEPILSLSVYNAQGETILNTKTIGADGTIDLGFAPAGIYLVRMETASGISAVRLVVGR